MLREYVIVSWRMMRSKPVRSVLSLLGIFIGVMALVIVMSIREGIRQKIENLYKTNGARVLYVHPGFDEETKKVGRLTADDLTRLQTVPGVESVQLRTSREMDVKTPAGALHAHVVGIDDRFIALYRVPVVRGRNFLEEEVVKKQPVCLISAAAAQKLFAGKDFLGTALDLQGMACQIIGVVNWSAEVAQRSSIAEADIFVPAAWVAPVHENIISQLEVRVRPEISARQALRVIRETLSRGDPQREKLYFVRSMEQFMERSREFTDTILAGLLGIAAISLLVGGIGVANVMITSVTERTREVGIRKAMGARRTDILLQFLVEASVLSVSGGVLAVLTGILGISLLQDLFHLPVPMAIAPFPVAACLGLTIVIGLLAGVYPASRAALLSPAEALRYE